MVIRSISELEAEQVAYIISYAVETHHGILCIYKDKLLIAGSPAELHELLKSVWEVTK